MNWTVHKFGGSSLADAECFRRVAGIISQRAPEAAGQAVVVSAVGGFTDALLAMVNEAASGSDAWRQQIVTLKERYTRLAGALIDADSLSGVCTAFEQDCHSINDVLQAVTLVRAASHRSRDLISGFGELWSARLLTRFLGDQYCPPLSRVQFVDARRVITVRHGEMGPQVLWDQTRARLAEAVGGDFEGTLVITGFIAADEEGLQTTLGRNGSDFSASIFGALLESTEINIWTDVAGVMSGDPRRVPDARVIRSMSYSEAMELAYFGARVIHPQTMAPAVEREIPIHIRSTFDPDDRGTTVASVAGPGEQIKGISVVDRVAVVNLEGAGMIGVPGTADRLFGALRDAGVSVIMISQGSSEHSICFAVPQDSAEHVADVLHKAFFTELEEGQIQNIDIRRNCSILAVVGDAMTGTPGIAGKFFGTLGRSGISVRAIAQGASERNISAVVDAEDATRALRAVHSGFYLSAKTVSVGVIGHGTVGAALLDQLSAQTTHLRERFDLDLRIRALAASRTMTLADRGIDLAAWREARGSNEPIDIEGLVDHVQADHLPHAVLIDCTASQAIADHYGEWLDRGIHIITPNKKAHSGPWDYYQALMQKSRASNTHFLYETTVGAGLPIIQTLRDLIDTGDEVLQVEGIFSGTLAYLFNRFDGQKGFSEIVREAKDQGYTEPDPREDLSGMDVARKTVILARELGLPLELTDLDVESLVPADLVDASPEDFLAALAGYDARMHEVLTEARQEDRVLRYVGRLDVAARNATVRVERFPPAHPFARIHLADNIVQFRTGRYSENPLIIQGPGAGPDVTAAGVFADLLRLTAYLAGQN